MPVLFTTKSDHDARKLTMGLFVMSVLSSWFAVWHIIEGRLCINPAIHYTFAATLEVHVAIILMVVQTMCLRMPKQ